MAVLEGFDASQVEPNTGFAPIPPGKYPAVIAESEMKPTSAGTGQYLKLTWEIIDGTAKGRKLFVNLNLVNPSDEAVKIARGELSAICRAVGVLKPSDSSELHNKPVLLNVGNRLRKDTKELEHFAKGYESLSAASTSSAPQQPAASGNAPPWRK